MKRTLLMFLAILVSTACQEKKEEPKMETAVEDTSSKDMAMEKFQSNTETVKNLMNAFIKEDTTAMAQYVTDDFIWSPPSVGRDSLSRSEYLSTMQTFMNTYEDIKFTNPQYYAGLNENQEPNGDVRVYGVWESNMTKGQKKAMLKYYGVFFFNDQGEITHVAEWYDTADLSKVQD